MPEKKIIMTKKQTEKDLQGLRKKDNVAYWDEIDKPSWNSSKSSAITAIPEYSGTTRKSKKAGKKNATKKI